MKKTISLCLLTLMLGPTFLCTYQNESIDPWKFIEYKLITISQSLDKKAHILRLIPACISGVIIGNITNSFGVVDNIANLYERDYKTIKNCTQGLIGTLGASFIYKIADTIIQHEVDMQTIHAFVTQWPEYKKYTPQQLHTIFDDVYEMYLFDPYSYKYYHNALDVLTIARNYIYYQFPETYGFHYKKTGISNNTKRIVNQFLNFAPVKMILNTIKLFV